MPRVTNKPATIPFTFFSSLFAIKERNVGRTGNRHGENYDEVEEPLRDIAQHVYYL